MDPIENAKSCPEEGDTGESSTKLLAKTWVGLLLSNLIKLLLY